MKSISKDSAIEKIDSALSTLTDIPPLQRNSYGDDVSDEGRPARKRRAVVRMKSTVDALTRPGSTFRVEADRSMNAENSYDEMRLEELSGILTALRDEITDGGYLSDVVALTEANVFADFLEMARELLSKGYKDPAAVLVGSVLEEHLRSLAGNADVAVEADGRPVKAEKLNADLAKSGTYEKGEQKQVTAWLDLRNDAAHGHFGKYDDTLVALMLEGVRAFLVRNPAGGLPA